MVSWRQTASLICVGVPALLIFGLILLTRWQSGLISTSRIRDTIVKDLPGYYGVVHASNSSRKPSIVTSPSMDANTRPPLKARMASLVQKQKSAKMALVDNQTLPGILNKGLDVRISISDALMYGKPRNEKVFLAIGIPSISRKETFYLEQTIGSLIDQSTKKQRKNVIAVVFLADFDPTKRKQIAVKLTEKFKRTIEDGFLQIIKARRDFYPSFENLKQNFNDEMTRVKWRSKQNYDYAYLMKYSAPLAEFYMQLEDDVIAALNYLNAIKLFIKQQNTRTPSWVCLEFSRLGFIGKLFHSEDVEKLAKLLMLFYDEQPVDWLFPLFNKIRVQKKAIYFPNVSLFQHMGAKSSLNNHDKK